MSSSGGYISVSRSNRPPPRLWPQHASKATTLLAKPRRVLAAKDLRGNINNGTVVAHASTYVLPTINSARFISCRIAHSSPGAVTVQTAEGNNFVHNGRLYSLATLPGQGSSCVVSNDGVYWTLDVEPALASDDAPIV